MFDSQVGTIISIERPEITCFCEFLSLVMSDGYVYHVSPKAFTEKAFDTPINSHRLKI